MKPTETQIIAARYSLGMASSDSLARFADGLLSVGVYTPAADELSSMPDLNLDDAGPLFEQLLEELAVPLPARDDALLFLLSHHIGQVASGAVAPRDGLIPVVCELRSDARLFGQMDALGITPFYGDYYSYDDLIESALPQDRARLRESAQWTELDRETRQHANEWLASHAGA